MLSEKYMFQSDRLGFRSWLTTDVTLMSELNSDPLVVEYFPKVLTPAETAAFVERMQGQFNEKGFCYFALDRLDTGEFIGFVGLSEQTFESDFTPCIDIGWRLSSKHWNNGFATEGALRCLHYAFDVLELEKVYSICPVVNIKSERIMQKIGMQKIGEFKHPKLAGNEKLEQCVLYMVENTIGS